MTRRLRISAVVLSLLLSASCAAAHVTDEFERIAEILGLLEGMEVADVGAGEGEWSEELARRVGETGHVWATEVDEDDVEDIRERIDAAGFGNVTTVLGEAEDTGLPDGCCDAILLRLVYHHFTDPEPMRASLRRALKPGALLAVIDIEPQTHWRDLPGVPDRGGHGIPSDQLVAEMTGDGFEVVARYEDWHGDDDHYCVVFRQSPSSPSRADRSPHQVRPALIGPALNAP